MKNYVHLFNPGARLCAIALAVCGLGSLSHGQVQVAQLTAQVDASDFESFGESVAISGNDVIVGAPYSDGLSADSGAAYIFHYQSGAWVRQARLVAPDAAFGDNFGISVGISGDFAVVGAWQDSVGGISSGSAYVFHRTGSTWTLYGAKLLASDGANTDHFGAAVGIDGDVIAIGAENGSGPSGIPADSGAAYIFRLLSGTWTQQAKLNANDLANGDLFGQRVAVSGVSVLIGSPFDDNASGVNAGSAYVFVDTGGGSWSQQGKLTAGVFSPGSSFGRAVAIHNDTAIIGAPLADVDSGFGEMINSGAAYVFTRSGGSWTAYSGNPLIGDTTIDQDEFGISVAVNGTTVAAGSYADIFYNVGDDFFVALEAGVGFVFDLQSGSWVQSGTLTAGDFAQFDQFSNSMAMGNGGTLIVGSHGNDLEDEEAGAAYIFDLGTGVADTDGDGLSDSVEIAMAGGGSCPSSTNPDSDGDGLSDGYENDFGPNICNPDADGDGLSDGSEVNTHSTDPALADTDGDGLNDGAEVLVHLTDPNNPDTDADGRSDGAEIAAGTNPHDSDTDDDGLSDGQEFAYGTDPLSTDTDIDGLGDGTEVTLAAGGPCPNPLNADSDGDGLNDGDEQTLGTGICNADTDGDGLSDNNESAHSTNPLDPDTDDDGLTDGTEVTLAAGGSCPNPALADTDGDGVSDGDELTEGLLPCDNDTDNDGLADGNEALHGTNPHVADTDGDGLLDGTEVDMAMGGSCPDPLTADSDGDTLSDGSEVTLHTNVCSADTDGDGFNDNIDPTPTVPGVPPAFLGAVCSAMAANVSSLDLSLFLGPNNNARSGRRNEMATLLNNAAKELNKGKVAPALAHLLTLENRIDDISPQPDWMPASPQKSQLHVDVVTVITLLQMLQ